MARMVRITCATHGLRCAMIGFTARWAAWPHLLFVIESVRQRPRDSASPVRWISSWRWMTNSLRSKREGAGENIDQTTQSVKMLGAATDTASAANDNAARKAKDSGSAWVDLAAKLYLVQQGYEAVGTASAASSSLIGSAVSGAINGAQSDGNWITSKIGGIWQDGIDKINTYIALNKVAGDNGVEFYQRITKAATDAGKPANTYLDIITNINKALERNLGSNGLQNGSTFNAMVVDLQKNGNLQGQTADVNRLNSSVTGPEQMKAGLDLIQHVLDAGEKLTAFKLAGTLLGPEAVENLRRDNDYIYQIQKSMDAVKDKDIVKQADVDRAVALQNRLDTVYKYLDDRNKKDSSDWSSFGIKIQELWVNAVENYAGVLKVLDSIFGRTQDIVNATNNIKPPPSMWDSVSGYFTSGMTPDQIEAKTGARPMSDADYSKGVLATRLGNPSNIARNKLELQKADDWLTPDQSSPSPAAPPAAKTDNSQSAWDRTTGSIERYIQTTQEAAKNIDEAAGVQEKFKTIAQLTAAGIKDGLTPEVARLKAETSDLSDRAAAAADALARMRVQSSINFDKKTAFLNADDLAIATKLKTIYGDDIPAALNSTYAAEMRLNNSMKELGGIVNTSFDSMTPAIRDAINGTTSLATGFKNLGLVAVKAMEDMIIKLMIIKPLQNAIMGGSGGGLLGFLGIGGASGAGAAASSASTLANNTGGAFFGPGFANGTDYAPGGLALVGEEGPEIVNLPRGASVTPNRQSMAAMDSSSVNVAFSPVYNVTGSGPEIAQLKAQMASDRADFEARTVAAVRKAKAGRHL
jgi:hypothetical protein